MKPEPGLPSIVSRQDHIIQRYGDHIWEETCDLVPLNHHFHIDMEDDSGHEHATLRFPLSSLETDPTVVEYIQDVFEEELISYYQNN